MVDKKIESIEFNAKTSKLLDELKPKVFGNPAICIYVNGLRWYSIGGEPSENSYVKLINFIKNKFNLVDEFFPKWEEFKEHNFDMHWASSDPNNLGKKITFSLYRGLTTTNDID